MRVKQSGITLIELMVALVIVAILAGIAVPSYRQHIIKTHRAEAKAALLNLMANQEKFYLQNNTYAGNALLDDAPPAGLGLPATTENGHYTLAITAADDESFTATATATGGQAVDTDCATFTLTSAGVKTATSAKCWD
jgi:type IV pilus assembly protein PilE